MTVAAVPTGMNTGVCTSPCAVDRTPVRARPLVLRQRQLSTFVLSPAGRRRRSCRNGSPGDGILVGPLHDACAKKGAHEHEERRTGKVKVGDEGVDGTEPVARRDEESGVAPIGVHDAGVVNRAFEKAHGGRADSDDSPAGLPHGIDPRRRLPGDLSPLPLHLVFPHRVRADRHERAGADMQRKGNTPDSCCGEGLEQSLREVQPGGRGGDGPGMEGEDGLIVAAVALIRMTPDVGWQRHDSVAIEMGQKLLPGHADIENDGSARLPGDDSGRHLARQRDRLPRLELAGRARENPPQATALTTHGRHLDRGAGTLPAHPDGHDPGIVDHENVARIEEPGEIREDVMGPLARPVDIQKARRIAGLHRACRDPVGRKVEVERVDPHRPQDMALARRWATRSGTKLAKSPPSKATSLTRRDEMNVWRSEAMRKTVSTPGSMRAFMPAIWNS